MENNNEIKKIEAKIKRLKKKKADYTELLEIASSKVQDVSGLQNSNVSSERLKFWGTRLDECSIHLTIADINCLIACLQEEIRKIKEPSGKNDTQMGE